MYNKWWYEEKKYKQGVSLFLVWSECGIFFVLFIIWWFQKLAIYDYVTMKLIYTYNLDLDNEIIFWKIDCSSTQIDVKIPRLYYAKSPACAKSRSG